MKDDFDVSQTLCFLSPNKVCTTESCVWDCAGFTPVISSSASRGSIQHQQWACHCSLCSLWTSSAQPVCPAILTKTTGIHHQVRPSLLVVSGIYVGLLINNCRIEEAFYKKAIQYYSNKIHTVRAHKVMIILCYIVLFIVSKNNSSVWHTLYHIHLTLVFWVVCTIRQATR